uniref:Cytochrome P450 CYP82D47-like n=1 Tax=Tanacetum cinerariifolium TaxID=118510 RepID=A0A699I018_TANCI|nr:cytochrome P450 CYP82D47-like [Tanacetum cinerariifolium]
MFLINDEEGVRFQNAVKRIFEFLVAFVASDFIPFTNRFDLGGYEKKMKIAGQEIDNIFVGWLKEHKRYKESEKQGQEMGNQVFIDVLYSVLQGASPEDFPGF